MIREDGTSTIETFKIDNYTETRCSQSGVAAKIDNTTGRVEVFVGFSGCSFAFDGKMLGAVRDVLSRALNETAVPA